MKVIDTALVQALIQYLSTKPWSEVHQAIPALMNLPDAPNEPDASAVHAKPQDT